MSIVFSLNDNEPNKEEKCECSHQQGFQIESNQEEVGKKEAPGRPTLFGTTKEFLKQFRLNSISELPKLDEDDEERFELAR